MNCETKKKLNNGVEPKCSDKVIYNGIAYVNQRYFNESNPTDPKTFKQLVNQYVPSSSSGHDDELRGIEVIGSNGSTNLLSDYITNGKKLIDTDEVNQIQSTLMGAINNKCDYRTVSLTNGIVEVGTSDLAGGLSITDFKAELFANNKLKLKIKFYLTEEYDPVSDKKGLIRVNLENNAFHVDYTPMGAVQTEEGTQATGRIGEECILCNVSTSGPGGYTDGRSINLLGYVYQHENNNFYFNLKPTADFPTIGEDSYYVEIELTERLY
jgi:hypothetical protein